MKLILLQVGKTDNKYLLEGLSLYHSRIGNMIPFDTVTVQASGKSRNKPEALQKKEESERIAANFQQGDIIVLLDESGKTMKSRGFARFLQKNMNRGPKRIVFIIGGPFGVSDELKNSASFILSLSEMTFSHQLVRLLFAEQLYRALTIIRGIPYHHD